MAGQRRGRRRTALAAHPVGWADRAGHDQSWAHDWFFRALFTAFGADLIRPSLSWLAAAHFRRGILTNIMARCRDAAGFTRLQALCSGDPDVSSAAVTRTTYRASLILAAKGGAIADITIGDMLELLDAEAVTLSTAPGATHLFYRVLRTMGVFGADAPATLRELRTVGQRTPEQLIDRYGLVCRPIRNLLVDYLKERQPALDYTSLNSLANFLGGLFWADLERHHPASTACTCRPRSPRHGNSGYARFPRPSEHPTAGDSDPGAADQLP